MLLWLWVYIWYSNNDHSSWICWLNTRKDTFITNNMIIFRSNSLQKVSSPWYLRRNFKIIVTLTSLLIISFITTYLLIMRDKEQVRKEEANANIIITLRTFYYKTNGDNWTVSIGWNDKNDLSICGWYGIICEALFCPRMSSEVFFEYVHFLRDQKRLRTPLTLWPLGTPQQSSSTKNHHPFFSIQ